MKSSFSLTCLLCLGAFTGAIAAAETSHPIEKVIKLLDGLKEKSIAEGKGEQVAYNKFAYWCQESTKTLKDAIDDESEKIAELEDTVDGKTKDKEVLEAEIETLEGQLGDMDAAALRAKKQRKTEADLYKKVLGDVKGTIQAVNDAMTALQGAEGKTEGLLLAQTNVKKVIALLSMYSSTTDAQLNTLRSFGRPDQLAKGDLGKHVDKYDFKSENVIELLKALKQKFQDEKLQATKEETNALNSYELAQSSRDNAVKAAEKSKAKKTDSLAATNKVLSQSKKELKDTEEDKKADSKSLADTKEQCAMKKREWEDRSKVRENEIEAMDVAKKILSKASGVRTDAPSNPVPPPSPALIQTSDNGPKMAAVALIRQAADRTNSNAMKRLAVEVQAHLSGPFDQVNNMIEKMIFRLMDEQKQEDEHKHWCDQELKKTNVMKDDKEDKVKDLTANIKSEKAKVNMLTNEIQSADDAMAKIVTFKKEATEIRETGKKENKLAIEDSETAQKALANAIAVLTDFYKESGEIAKKSWELIQAPAKLPKNPATWDSSYTGVSDPDSQPGGIITVLETVMSDFAKMEADAKSQEAQDQKAYDQDMSDNDIEMSRRRTESDMKSDEKKRRAGNIADLSAQRKNTAGELEKTNQYLEDLKPACVSGDSSYKDRKAARSDEIDALKKAQVTLQEAFSEKKGLFLEISRH